MAQLAGSRCSVCDGVVISELDGVRCAGCNRAFHRRCLENPRACARCGADFTASEKAEKTQETRKLARSVRLGRRVTLLLAAVFVLHPVVELLVTGTRYPENVSFGNWIAPPVSLLTAGLFATGHPGAVKWIRVLLALSAFLYIAVFCLSITSRTLGGIVISSVILALDLVALYLVTLYEPVRPRPSRTP